jgi:type IV pilus assembly protein PilN
LIKINLVREGRAVRGAGAGASPAAAAAVGGGGASINNVMVIALAALGVLAAAGYWFWQKRELSHRQEVVRQRQTEATKLETIIREVENYQKRKDSLQQRIDLINQLKQNQKGPVRIMDQISRDLPDLVWLDKLSIDGQKITLNGRGLNANAIANFVENIKKDPFFEEPTVGAVTQVSAEPLVYTFDMNFSFTYVPKPAAGATPVAGSTTTTAAATGTDATQ